MDGFAEIRWIIQVGGTAPLEQFSLGMIIFYKAFAYAGANISGKYTLGYSLFLGGVGYLSYVVFQLLPFEYRSQTR